MTDYNVGHIEYLRERMFNANMDYYVESISRLYNEHPDKQEILFRRLNQLLVNMYSQRAVMQPLVAPAVPRMEHMFPVAPVEPVEPVAPIQIPNQRNQPMNVDELIELSDEEDDEEPNVPRNRIPGPVSPIHRVQQQLHIDMVQPFEFSDDEDEDIGFLRRRRVRHRPNYNVFFDDTESNASLPHPRVTVRPLRCQRKTSRLYSANRLTQLAETECAVCFERPTIENSYKTSCGHTFCYTCFDNWERRCLNDRAQVTCPSCREMRPVLTTFAARRQPRPLQLQQQRQQQEQIQQRLQILQQQQQDQQQPDALIVEN